MPWMIEVKTPNEIQKMRAAGRVAREVLDIAGRAVKVGITTDEIDQIVHDETLKVSVIDTAWRMCVFFVCLCVCV
jgi:methionyl aminopeptidase